MKLINEVLLIAFLVILSSCGSDTKSKKDDREKTTSSQASKTIKKGQALPKENTINKSTERVSKTKLSTTVKLGSIDYNLINARLFQKINKERKRLGLPLFKNNNNLKKAAKIHNDYMVRAGILDHIESGTSTPRMRDRVSKAGGKFRTAGENIQFEGFTIRTTNGVESIVAPTYEALAEQLWQNWKTSPPHYKNLTNPEFIYLGTALKWSDKKSAVFATQVYGG